LAIAVSALVIPLSHADPNLDYQGYIAPTETGYVLTQTDQFFLPLHAGDVITSTVTWGNPNADLDLRLAAPGTSCQVLPNPDVNCLVGGRLSPSVPTCSYQTEAPFVNGNTQETFTKTAAVSGTYEIDVEAAWVNPVTDGGVAYDLSVYVNGVQVDMSGATPTTTNYIHSTDLICHAALP
jgi:hypothetical protein